MKFSIIVPVYNAEKNIEKTIQDICKIEYNKSEYEIIVVNDGSQDNSLNILLKLKNKIENLKILNKNNGGVSSARNYGIKAAKGSYILFIDADDSVSPNLLNELEKFINKYKNINIIVYNLIYSNGNQHWRTNYLKKSGVYDANKYCYASLTTINICVKNRFKDNILFNENTFIHEDEEYSANNVEITNNFGFVAEASYFYNNKNLNSVMNTKLNPYYSFNPSVKLYKNLLTQSKNKNNGSPSKYIQSLIINDLSWKLRSNSLYSLNENVRKRQTIEIAELLLDISPEIILNHPNIDLFHKQYFLKLRKTNIEITTENIKIIEKIDNIKIHVKENHIYITNITFNKNNQKINISGFFKNYISDYLDWSKINIFVIMNGKDSIICNKRETFYSYHRSNTKTNNFIGFDVEIPIEFKDFCFYVVILSNCYKVNRISFKNFNLQENIPIEINNLKIEFIKKSAVFINRKNIINKVILGAKNYLSLFKISKKRFLFRIIINFYCKNVVLYSDREGVFDNALYKFLHDLELNKKNKKFYIYHTDNDKKKLCLDYKVKEKDLIKFNSFKHKILYLNSIRIYTSFVDYNFYMPFGLKCFRKYYGYLKKPEVIYLQHGVLHAINLHYAAEFLNIDKITIATKQELKYFIYLGFKEEQLLKIGLERLKKFRRNSLTIPQKINKILYVPSWRAYLAIHTDKNEWLGDKEKFFKSNYWNELNKLDEEEFKNFLNNNKIYFYISMHPIFSNIELKFFNPNIRITNEPNINEYDLIITDYSSIVYDAVYIGKPIVYYCPDIEEYNEGLNLYCDTLVKMTNGFGPLACNYKEFINIMSKYVENPNLFLDYKSLYNDTFFSF